jgi:DNA-binding NtrC family response regulator
MADFMKLVQRVVGSGTSLLILGETGVGKERLARAIHRASGREGAFVAVNCGALPESLLESELFGHEEGAFTGASRTRRGCFELAHRGTIFLDEIAEMPSHLQVRLLRVLQEREVQRVGAEWPLKVDVRVMAATSQELEQQVRAGRFRSDLLYRLGVVSLEVPPLRWRREDIPELVQSYINHFAAELGRDVQSIEPAALEALQRHDWPGNVRELINAIERATLLCDGPRIAPADLPQAVLAAADTVACGPPEAGGAPAALALPPAWHEQPLKAVREVLIERLERMYLIAQLEATGGRIDETARRAGITPRALFDKMQRYRLRKEDFRAGRKR